ncbi:serine/threonine-protein kinase haspin-like [Oppia nitens]|uniref:serine/threonine-protein kinase haspin-like n=1 Tax=Oppia nitens TaxID=1686743 RepID=UPI0023DA99AA|nr:serine/threonine-protein kinase haspin-like [Oppia nitens]
MWNKIKKKVRKVIQILAKKTIKNRKEEFGDNDDEDSDYEIERQISLQSLHSNDMQLQVDGNYLSNSIIKCIVSNSLEDQLMNICRQKEIYRLENIITKEIYRKMKILWSGCYSEVIKVVDAMGKPVVIKISLINRKNSGGLVVQDMSSVLTDVINSRLLSDLKAISVDNALNYTENFADIRNCYYVWTDKSVFNGSKGKENDNKFKTKKYKYVLIEQSFGGRELESVDGMSPNKALSLALQLIASLAVAEEAIEFEHRDLHCSNILVDHQTTQQYCQYAINGHKFRVKLNGIKLTLIDTTFSRTRLKIAINSNKEYENCFYSDLTHLNLDDYHNKLLKQVYTKQTLITSNNWRNFHPKTNILWIDYCVQQLCQKMNKWCLKNYSSSHMTTNHYSVDHKQLIEIKDNIISCESAKDLAKFCHLI